MLLSTIPLVTGTGASLALLAGLLVATALYFAPSAIAIVRGHHQVGAIIAVNAFLGWSLIGWVVALAMALSAMRQPNKPAFVPTYAAPQAGDSHSYQQ